MNGVINVYKEAGVTSFHVVARIRKIFNIKKVGHTGTLDPMAEGVLPICIGSATRFADLLTAHDKQYIAQFKLGKSFDTFDTTGTVINTSDKIPTKNQIEDVLQSFIGNKEMVVPAFSAKKINGERAYVLARKGELDNAGSSFMNIINIELMSYEYPNGAFVVDCGKGTYVRSIINELGILTGAYAAMSGLIRSKNGKFTANNALKLSEIEDLVADGKADTVVAPVQNVLELPKFIINKIATARLANGISPKVHEYTEMPIVASNEPCLIMDNNDNLLALGEFQGGNVPIKLSKVFN